MSRSVSNNGIGALYASFLIHQTGPDTDLGFADIGTAVGLSGNNEIDHGNDGGALLGRLEHVRDNLATVQIAGVVRLPFSGAAPDAGDAVELDGAGGVKKAPSATVNLDASGTATVVAAGGPSARGTVLAVDSGNATVDVLLG